MSRDDALSQSAGAEPTRTHNEAPRTGPRAVLGRRAMDAVRRPGALALLFALVYVIILRTVAAQYRPPEIMLAGWIPILAGFAGYGFVLSIAWRRFHGQPSPVSAALRAAPAALALQLMVAPVLAAHVDYKIIMQEVRPFYLDAALMNADRFLHFGVHPFQLIPSWPPLTRFLDLGYYLWYPVLFMCVTCTAWLSTGRTRARVFVAFVLCWFLLGCVLATLLSSAGPAYVERLGISSVYVPLTDYLRGLDLMAVAAHENLWQGYLGLVAPTGISAMPSLHVAIPALFTLAVWRRRRLRWLGVAFTAIIMLGSVHLAWHYALDAYVSLAGVFGTWWLAGRMVDLQSAWSARFDLRNASTATAEAQVAGSSMRSAPTTFE